MRKSKAIAEVAPVPDGSRAFLAELKERIQVARLQASLYVNRELILTCTGGLGALFSTDKTALEAASSLLRRLDIFLL
jgi:hypothetical protein